MIKLTITKLGTPNTVITKYGPKEKNWLQATEYGAKYLNYWVNPTSKNWQVGQVVEIEGVEERTYPSKKTGKDEISYDIKLPKTNGDNSGEVLEAISTLKNIISTQNDKIDHLTKLVGEVHKSVLQIPEEKLKVPGTEIEYPVRETDDVPFE